MSIPELVAEAPAERVERRSWRVRAVSALGPLTIGGGLAWALAQPYRVTLLHPSNESVWWLAVQPPLLVVFVGALFHVLVRPGLVEDLEGEGEGD